VEKDFRDLTSEELALKREELAARIKEVAQRLPRRAFNIEPPVNPSDGRKEIILP
jgi:hypothetical protein